MNERTNKQTNESPPVFYRTSSPFRCRCRKKYIKAMLVVLFDNDFPPLVCSFICLPLIWLLRPQIRPLRPQIRPLRPQITPFRPLIRPLRPLIRPYRIQVGPLRPQISQLKPQISPLRL